MHATPTHPPRRRTLLALVAALLTVATAVVTPSPAAAARFDDVPPGSVFVEDVDRLAAARVTRGCNPPANTRFCPDRPVTRGAMAAFLARALGLPPADEAFLDVADGDLFAAPIGALAAAGITRGCNPPANDRYCPDQLVTRQQMAAFLARALDLALVAEPFADVPDDSVFASSIGALAASGITRGCNPPGNDRFCPTEVLRRDEMAAFLVRAGLAPHPADDVAGLVRGATAASRDGSADAPTLTRGTDGTVRAGLPQDVADPEPFDEVVHDVVRPEDPSTFVDLAFVEVGRTQFYDFDRQARKQPRIAYHFRATYSDGPPIDIHVGQVGSVARARQEAELHARPLGQLPTLLRREVGTLRTEATSTGQGAVGSDEGIDITLSTAFESNKVGLLEEVLLQAAVEAGFGSRLSLQRADSWLRAQVLDGRWLTASARQDPDRRDVATSTVYAYALLHERDRLPADVEQAVLDRIPNRVARVALLLPPGQPIHTSG